MANYGEQNWKQGKQRLQIKRKSEQAATKAIKDIFNLHAFKVYNKISFQ